MSLNFKLGDWEVYKASGYPAFITPFAVSCTLKFRELYGSTCDVAIVWEGKNFTWLFDTSQLITCAEKFLPVLEKKQWAVYDEWQQHTKKFTSLHYNLMQAELTKENVAQWAKNYFDSFCTQYAQSNFIEPLSYFFQVHASTLLPPDPHLLEYFGRPARVNYLTRFFKEIQDGKREEVLRKFHYINNDYTGPRPVDDSFLSSLCPTQNQQNPPENVPDHFRLVLNCLQITVTIQDVRKAQSILRALATFNQTKYDSLKWLTWEDILQGESLKEQRDHCIIHWTCDGTTLFTGKEYELLLRDFYKHILKIEKGITEVKGISASNGKIVGRAVLVNNVSQFHKVKEGDILITGMTRPEYIPVMKRSAAFVTDEGGLTSHAAIISREMKKPCVIGTRIATKVFKDGDIVEVDAEKGVIRKITKKHESTYRFLWGNKQSVLTLQWNALAFRDYRSNIWNQVDNIIQISHESRIRTFHSIKDLHSDERRGENILYENYMKKYFEEQTATLSQHSNFFMRLRSTGYKKLTNQELYDLVRLSLIWCAKTISFFRSSQEEGTKIAVNKLRVVYNEKEVSILLISPELDLVNRERMDWAKLVRLPYSSQAVIAHAYQYPWIVIMHHSFDEVEETLKQRFEFEKSHEFHADFKKEKIILREKQNILLNKNKKIGPLVRNLQRLVHSRMEVKSRFAGTDFYTIPLHKEIANRTGVDIKYLREYYLLEDFESLLLRNRRVSKNEITNRQKLVVCLWKSPDLIIKSGDEAIAIAKRELGDLYEVEKKYEVTGSVANSGKVHGVARILQANDVEQARKFRKNFKEGQILITQMTQPNIMDIASKAAAIVTDEGGMLSHAAIISRELHIPCIVGTFIATSNFDDGDIIEVDAEKGIVRKL